MTTHTLALRSRNSVSTAEGGIPKNKSQVKAFGISPDQQTLCTLDEMADPKTKITVLTLKFWSRKSSDFSDFNLDQVTHLTTKPMEGETTEEVSMSIEPINNMAFAISVGNQDVRIWGQIRQQQEGGEASRLVWCVVSALKFRDLRVK